MDFVWRSGVHVADSGLWCDAPRAHDLCFLSSAQAFQLTSRTAWQRSALLCSDETWRLCQSLDARATARSLLLSPTGRPFQLGVLRLELFASGGLPGAASLWLRLPSGRTLIYAGAPNPCAEFSFEIHAEPMQVRAAETVVCHAPLATVTASVPTLDEAMEGLRAVLDAGRAAATVSVLLCPTLNLAPVLARSLLTDDKFAARGLQAHPHIVQAVRACQPPSSSSVPKLHRHARPLRAGQILLWPLSSVHELPSLPQLVDASAGGVRIYLCSGLGLLDDAVAACRRALDKNDHELSGICPFPDLIDRQGLLKYVAATEARELLLTTGYSETLASLLRRGRHRVEVTPLGPPSQLPLLP